MSATAPAAADGVGRRRTTRPRTSRLPASCLYAGTVRHRRSEPRSEFRHPIALAYLDLDELPQLLHGRLERPGPGLLRFRRRDYLDGARPGPPALSDAVRARVVALGGPLPAGPIRVLTQLRSLGLCFNPVSFYYCFDAAGERLESVLAEVTNTPWGERHAYLLAGGAVGSPVRRGEFAKQLHVSPLFGMDHVYDARASTPGETLSVHIANHHAGETVFDATLSLRRRALDRRGAAWLSARHPAATARVLALIYGHALALRARGARWHPHPDRAAAAS